MPGWIEKDSSKVEFCYSESWNKNITNMMKSIIYSISVNIFLIITSSE
jgi:hypothetical protein